MRRLVGVDGCRAGWCVADGDGLRVVGSFEEAVAGASLALVDVPIGLLDAPRAGGRPCDAEARRLLSPFGHRVFSPPTRAHLAAASFAACRGLSLQAWNLVPKVREADAAMTPARQRRVREAHPELAFAALVGAPLPSKRSAEGRRARLRALGLRRVEPPRGARVDDALDALALRWAAGRRLAALGGGRDARGLRMEIAHPAPD